MYGAHKLSRALFGSSVTLAILLIGIGVGGVFSATPAAQSEPLIPQNELQAPSAQQIWRQEQTDTLKAIRERDAHLWAHPTLAPVTPSPSPHPTATYSSPAPEPTTQAPSPTPTPEPTTSSPPTSGGTDWAATAFGDCVRKAENGGSYSWGTGNGGGAYQFLESTWMMANGSVQGGQWVDGSSAGYGSAGQSWQDAAFNNVMNNPSYTGGANNWGPYDGCWP